MRTRHLTQTGVLNLVAQVALLAVLYAVGHEHPLGAAGVWRNVILLSLVLGQSAIWVGFFYLQDRAEPEPTRYVVAAFAAGLAAASLVALPAEHTLFRLSSWLFQSTTSLVIGATCVRGALFAWLVYAIVRYGFAPDPEFDEPADGMAYGAFAGSGIAAATSLSYLSTHADFTLFAIANTAAMNLLVYASVGALVGYLVGRTKFRSRPSGLTHALAILIGAALVGLYHALVEYALSTGTLWAGAATAVAFAIVVLGTATVLMYRLTAKAMPASAAPMRAIDPLAIGMAIALLATGAYATSRAIRPVEFNDARYAIAFRYDPIATVSAGADAGAAVTQAAFGARRSTGLSLVFSARTERGAMITVQRESGTVAIDQIDVRHYLQSADPIGLTTKDVTIGGAKSLRLRYAYVIEPAGIFSRDLPRLHWAYTDVVPGAKDTYALSYDAAPDAFEHDEPVYASVLSSVSWPNR